MASVVMPSRVAKTVTAWSMSTQPPTDRPSVGASASASGSIAQCTAHRNDAAKPIRSARLRLHDVAMTLVGVASKLKQYNISSNSTDRKSTRLNSSHVKISYAVFCLKKKKKKNHKQ